MEQQHMLVSDRVFSYVFNLSVCYIESERLNNEKK